MKNLPNILTITRVIITVSLPFLLLQEERMHTIVAFILFIIASITDYLDGKIARKYKSTSNFGKIADPIADKLLTLTLFTTFGLLGTYSLWWVLPIFTREVGITIYRLLKLREGKIISAEKSGKIKTTVQIITISFIFILSIIAMTPEYSRIEDALEYTLLTTLILSTAITIYSGMEFINRNYKRKKS